MAGFGHNFVNVNLRKVSLADEPFLFKLYASTRQDEFSAVPWSDEQLEAFLRMQFDVQQRAYAAQYPHAEYHIILLDEVAAGAIRVNHMEDKIHLVDIALLPEYRDAGIGSSLLKELLADSERSLKTVNLYVLKTNRAIKLYERLGFSVAGDDGMYLLMERCPGK